SGEDIIYEQIQIIDAEPIVSTADLELLMTYTISSASSRNTSGDDITDPARMEERQINIERAINSLNNIILLPGEVFNFWDEIGSFRQSSGYVMAYDNSAGALEKVLGGGISQLASAIYYAALTSDLEIGEQSNYPYTVNYGPLGFDAHVIKNEKNLVFINSLDFPIRISLSYEDHVISAKILGTDTNSNREIKTHSESKAISFKTIYIEDPNLEEGTEILTQAGIMGYEVQVFKKRLVNGVELISELLGTVAYEARDEIITIGTKTED
ncbi:MAG: VanW family protein, partial [Tissierellia bacterium]|nr:VanW family protein [Tissierellia bacterium]